MTSLSGRHFRRLQKSSTQSLWWGRLSHVQLIRLVGRKNTTELLLSNSFRLLLVGQLVLIQVGFYDKLLLL